MTSGVSDLQGKTVLLTGATAGIGRATAQALAARGADLLLVARDRAKGEALAADLRGAGAGQVQLFYGDLSSLSDVRRVAQEIQSARGQLHGIKVSSEHLLLPSPPAGEGRCARSGVRGQFSSELAHVEDSF
jgi:NAD(P)-dependent dehydrogenase (short-subunit alcohol dehydrogenase family)